MVKSFTPVPICLDTEGAQIRTGRLKNKIVLINGERIIIKRNEGIGENGWFNLYPKAAFEGIEVGDIINIDFNSVMVQVIEKNESEIKARVLMGGLIQQNKAVTINKDFNLNPLTNKDLESIKIGEKYDIKYFALSFANKESDVNYLRSIINPDCKIISKIESIQGLINLESITNVSDNILIDRGDLSREISIENLPSTQKHIIDIVKQNNKKVFVATNLLESMINNVLPTRAEINDIYNTLFDGADGLVLAAETAIGKYPIQCATMIRKMITQHEKSPIGEKRSVGDLIKEESLILPLPHGGELVNQRIDISEIKDISSCRMLEVDLRIMMDAEQIAIGTFSPLTGFMNKEEIDSVLDNYKLLNGNAWTLPIFIQISNQEFKKLSSNDSILITLKNENEPYAMLTIESMFKLDLEKMAKRMFFTNDIKHPGVNKLFEKGNCFLSGRVDLIKRIPSKFKYYEMTPNDTRKIIENRGWSRVAGFHTRNIPHRVHEYIQEYVFDNYSCDGLFIHPVVGPKKSGDFLPEIIIESYELLIDNYINEKSLLGAFQSYSRYAGPREALFTALCRKNFGCSHFIIGRDHTGVGSYYSDKDFDRIFAEIDDLGINLIKLDEYVYSTDKKSYMNLLDVKNEKTKSISGTEARQMLYNGQRPPDWYMRKEISDYIINSIKIGKEVFIK